MSAAWLRSIRNQRWTWILPLALVVINTAIFAFYQLVYAGEVEALRRRFERENETLEQRLAQRTRLASYLERVQTSRGGINTLYLDDFKTAPERLTATLAEIERLAQRAGIDPPAFSYPSAAVEGVELRELGINFAVEGTYEQLRRFINLLEVSDQFLILRAVSLNRSGDAQATSPRVSITLQAATLFITDALAARTRAARAAQDAGAREPAASRDTPPASPVDPHVETGSEVEDGPPAPGPSGEDGEASASEQNAEAT